MKAGENMPVSEAQQKAVNKYLKNNFDDIKIRVPKGEREEYKKRVTLLGYESFNKFIIDAVNEKLGREEKSHEQ